MFPSAPILSQLSPVNLRDPVNRSHPLNRGRVAWWLTLPGWYGGQYWYDLMGLNPGTLTSMGNANNGWRATARPGGWGRILCDGTAGSVDGSTTNLVTTGKITVACWMSPNVLTRGDVVTRWSNGSQSNDQFNLLYGLTSGKPQFFKSSGGSIADSGVGSSAMSVGGWYRVVGTFDGGTISVYLNGVLQSSAASGLALTTASGRMLRVGRNDSTDGFYNGSVDDVSLWSRALSPAEVWADYDLSRRGYPGVLNRVPMWAYPAPAAGGGSWKPFWMQRGQILGTGVAA